MARAGAGSEVLRTLKYFSIVSLVRGRRARNVDVLVLFSQVKKLDRYEQFASAGRLMFLVAACLYPLFIFMPSVIRSEVSPDCTAPVRLVLLLMLLASGLLLTDAAHLGGRVVRQYGLPIMTAPDAEG